MFYRDCLCYNALFIMLSSLIDSSGINCQREDSVKSVVFFQEKPIFKEAVFAHRTDTILC